VRTLRAPPPAWLESGTPPDNSSRHIIAAGTFAAADPAHIIVAGSERRAPRPPLAHPPTLAHTACRTALAPARSRSHDLYTTHGTHLDKRPSALHVPSVAIVKLAAVAIVKLSRRRCRKPPLSQAAAVRCRDGQASAVAMVKLALSRSAMCTLRARRPHTARATSSRPEPSRPPPHRAEPPRRPTESGGLHARRSHRRQRPPPARHPTRREERRRAAHARRTHTGRAPLLPPPYPPNTDSHSLLQPSNARLRWVVRPACPPAARRPPPPPPPPPPPTRGGRTTPLNPHTSVT